jgi:precorrin-6B methylase 2
MEKMTNWIKLWQELVDAQSDYRARKGGRGRSKDHWKDKAREFDKKVRERWERPDPHRDFILSRLRASPGASVLDIGAGTGSWALLMAPEAQRITALEPSADMRKVMAENLEREGIDNVDILNMTWPSFDVTPHDFSFCSHAMYGARDLPSFISAMVNAARQSCFILIRALDGNGLLAQAAQKIWGQPNDSPNFSVAYGVLRQMGISPNVIVDHSRFWPPWTHPSLEEALKELFARFNVQETSPEGDVLRNIVESRLTYRNGRYVWPAEVRSAMIYWNV